MQVERNSPCKINLILNILGKRPDGFHQLETVMQPVPIYDVLRLDLARSGIQLACDNPELPVDSTNLVYRAAARFLDAAGIRDGVRIHLEKRIPISAGLGGGSGNAATTLLALNQLFNGALGSDALDKIARELGSDVPFFLQTQPALATGRGENVQPLEPFPSLTGFFVLLIHPGFGVSTPWAYKNLARFPGHLNGITGRAIRLVEALQSSLDLAKADFYNALEAPVHQKFPLLAMFKEFLVENGALAAMMSGSGSTTFALIEGARAAELLQERFKSEFGDFCWIKSAPLG